MKKFFILIITLILMVSFLQSNSVNNTDKPVRGEWDLKVKQMWSVSEAGDLPVLEIDDVAESEDGRIYVLSHKYARVSVFSPEGKFISSFGKKGEGPGEFKFCFWLRIIDKTCIVVDTKKLHYFTLDGKFIKSVVLPKMNDLIAFISKDSFIYSKKNKENSSETGFLYSIKSESSKELFKTDSIKEVKARAGGMSIALRIPVLSPTIVGSFTNGRFIYGKNDKYRIQGITLDGSKVLSFSISDRERTKVTQKYKEDFFGKSLKINGGPPPKGLLKKLTASIPDYATYFGDIFVTESGHFLINTNDLYKKNLITYDIFSPEGKYIHTASFDLSKDLKMKRFWITDKCLYIYVEDEDGEYSMVKYSIELP